MIRLLIVALLLFPVVTFGQRTILHCGNLIDGKSDKVQSAMTIIVEGDKIISVQSGYFKPADNDKVIDLRSKTVMPGFIDMHVHIEYEMTKDYNLQEFTMNDADIAFQSTEFAKRTLHAGFTTVRDLGGTGVNISLRNAINQGLIEGPRIITAGKALASTGGHADPTNGYRKDLMGIPGPNEGVVNSAEEARQAVRQRYKEGSDCIKITATGGVISLAKDGSGPQFTMDELEAIIKTAKDYGMHVAAHAHGAEGMKRAVMAGITTIEHGTMMTDEVMELMKQKGTYYVPTITAGRYVADRAKIPGFYHPVVAPKALQIGPQIQKTFARAYKHGVKIAFGTDAGVYPHGQNGKEFALMVEAGMPPMEAIKAATIVNATILQMEDKIGTIEAGKLADIVASDENPINNINTLQHISFIMKNGIVLSSK